MRTRHALVSPPPPPSLSNGEDTDYPSVGNRLVASYVIFNIRIVPRFPTSLFPAPVSDVSSDVLQLNK